ncbi:hypothetical protein [Mesorhizobium sp.]|uniref:hypothetical protein n=1 Tax=Mesorhizobium sp. TaxID=1871066 RepID=UPI0025C40B8E|nr:hypothetical protein [Mesorhizobium sp.]
MKKFFLTLAGAAVLAGSMAVAPEPAEARHWQGHRHHQVCRIVVKKRVAGGTATDTSFVTKCGTAGGVGKFRFGLRRPHHLKARGFGRGLF